MNYEVEIDNYLNEMITPVAPESADVYQWWWCGNQRSFPI